MVNVLLVTFPAQGHINPSLQFAKRLSKLGVKVIFLTSLSAIRRITATSSSVDALIDFVSFSDGYSNGMLLFRFGLYAYVLYFRDKYTSLS
ncbi:UNVERIFIED_CONTAM: Anthocyanidin 3-O-glucoside 5-O-glucosyltransferase [Sesamum radiatum]|uniref:Anthocyanidin 3-O-glucoside 5-O-glucosyltransferase n=1 Tax=Sesamum radiatum TaxID=300843 RepID=A0AAW2VPP0_SESRA